MTTKLECMSDFSLARAFCCWGSETFGVPMQALFLVSSQTLTCGLAPSQSPSMFAAFLGVPGPPESSLDHALEPLTRSHGPVDSIDSIHSIERPANGTVFIKSRAPGTGLARPLKSLEQI